MTFHEKQVYIGLLCDQLRSDMLIKLLEPYFSSADLPQYRKKAKEIVNPTPKCSCCGATENLHEDLGSGGPYRCNSYDCVSF